MNGGGNGDSPLEADVMESRQLPTGHNHYRAYVGPPKQYDILGATQFSLLTSLGLQEEHTLMDVGCGSLRAGRFFIQYLLPDRYFGIEPNEYLWRSAIDKEIGRDILSIKRPKFSSRQDFRFDDSTSKYDFILAQSIFSHAGSDMFQVGLKTLASQLKHNGQFLFTIIDEDAESYSTSIAAESVHGWIYPGCTRYARQTVLRFCQAAGLKVEIIGWRHPRQTWYRAVLPGTPLLGAMAQSLGGGRVFFNPRYE
ncbi:MAG: hypothetical protein Kow00133_08720 [Amphiplicatus sp.]